MTILSGMLKLDEAGLVANGWVWRNIFFRGLRLQQIEIDDGHNVTRELMSTRNKIHIYLHPCTQIGIAKHNFRLRFTQFFRLLLVLCIFIF